MTLVTIRAEESEVVRFRVLKSSGRDSGFALARAVQVPGRFCIYEANLDRWSASNNRPQPLARALMRSEMHRRSARITDGNHRLNWSCGVGLPFPRL